MSQTSDHLFGLHTYLDIAVESIGAFLDLQNHKRNIIILWPAAGPFLAGCDVTFDDLFWRKMRGFGQYDLRLCIPEHLAAVIESFGKTVAHQDDHVVTGKRKLLLTPNIILHAAERRAFDGDLFDRPSLRVINQNGRHSGHTEGQAIAFHTKHSHRHK